MIPFSTQICNRNHEMQWQETWTTASHCIWMWCNKKNFHDHFIMPHNRMPTIWKLLHQYNNIDVIFIKWEPPDPSCLTLNMNGTVGKNVIASCGGVLWVSNDNWIIRFTKGLGRSNMPQVELWGILEGLKRIHSKADMKLCVQTDFNPAFEAIKRGNKIAGIRENLVRLIHKELRRFNETTIKSILREANSCTDYLEKLVL